MTNRIKVLLDRRLVLSAEKRFVAHIRVLSVPTCARFPLGIKAKFVLQDAFTGVVRLLIDNHEPYGFHRHAFLASGKGLRERLKTDDHELALNVFLAEVEGLVQNEKE